jgi:hypothetical protein
VFAQGGDGTPSGAAGSGGGEFSEYSPGDGAFASLAGLADRFQVDVFSKAVQKAAGGGGGMLGFMRRRSESGSPMAANAPLTVGPESPVASSPMAPALAADRTCCDSSDAGLVPG